MKHIRRPLEGIRVLDVGNGLAGLYCSTILGDFGAEVIKIEPPGIGDPARKYGARHHSGEAFSWLIDSRNKLSATLNLKTNEGANLFKKLISKADVVIDNFGPGILESWGLGWGEFQAINPKLILVRMSGYDDDQASHDKQHSQRISRLFGSANNLNVSSVKNLVSILSTNLVDYFGATYGALGVMLALRSTEEIGRGQVIDVALEEVIFSFLRKSTRSYDDGGFVREWFGRDMAQAAPKNIYETSDGKRIAIACINDEMFVRLTEILEQPQLAQDDAYANQMQRLEKAENLDNIVAAWADQKTQKEALEILNRKDILAGPFNLFIDLLDAYPNDPHAIFTELQDNAQEQVSFQNVLPKLSRTPGRINKLGPKLGADNSYIYTDLLGLGEQEIEELSNNNII